jgi:putative ABC transport system permease protein
MAGPSVHLSEALRGLASYPLRAALTALGIVIGVAAVITVLSVGEGARRRVIEQIQSLGGNLLLVTPGSARTGAVQLGAGSRQTLTMGDADAIRRDIPRLLAVAPSVFQRLQVVRGNRNWQTTVQGVTPDYLQAREWGVISGRPLSAVDQARSAKAALLGATVAQRLFEGETAVGKIIRIGDAPFAVIGVLVAKGQSSGGSDQDDKVMIPLSTAMVRGLGAGRSKLGGLRYVMVKVDRAERLGEVEAQLVSLLRQRHDLRPGYPDDFSVRNLAEVQAQREEASGVLTFWLGAVASVSLVVGGVSVMNIMLVAVAERTREIGLRLAVGARRRDILWQFLTEALLLALLGGAAGVALGVLLSLSIARWGGLPVEIGLVALLLSLAAAAAAGLCAGVLPALKAARLTPIEALRSE